jgi:hypothetical protein
VSARLTATLALLVAVCAGPAFALDPGTASGHFTRDGVRLNFSHAIALSQDNTEGLLDHGPQVRVLLSAEDVPIAALYGIVFPPVRALARQGKVHGVLLEFDPADKTQLHVTVLVPPKEPGEFAANISLSNSGGVWKKLSANATRIGGDYDAGSDADLAFTFSAPVFTDPVQADLKGPAAQASNQVKALLTRAQAVGRGDLPAALAVSSRDSGLREVPPGQVKEFAKQAPAMIKQIKAIKRVVVRRETAIALMGEGSWSSLVMEDGVWKVAD